jgi:hypothetical protein
MLILELRYVAHVTMLTHNTLKETWETNTTTIRDLVDELDLCYHGFKKTFVENESGQLRMNAMIYYNRPGDVPISVIDLDLVLSDQGVITFW